MNALGLLPVVLTAALAVSACSAADPGSDSTNSSPSTPAASPSPTSSPTDDPRKHSYDETAKLDGWKIRITEVIKNADPILATEFDKPKHGFLMVRATLKRVAESKGSIFDLSWTMQTKSGLIYDRQMNVSTPNYWGYNPKAAVKGGVIRQEIVFDMPAKDRRGTLGLIVSAGPDDYVYFIG